MIEDGGDMARLEEARRWALVLSGAAALGLGAVATASAAQRVTIYLTRGPRLQLAMRVVPAGRVPVQAALRRLVGGPTPAERRAGVRTAIPRRTRVLGLDVRDGVAYARLSAWFSTGTMRSRREATDQVVRTLVPFPKVDAVRILVGDEPAPAPGTPDPPGTALRLSDLPARPVVPLPPRTVADVQRRLIDLRFLPQGAVSGELDYRTQQALLAFQGWQGIGRDGVAAPATLQRLQLAGVPTPRQAEVGRRVEIYRDRSVLLLIDGGAVVRAVHVSTGAGGRTPSGSFAVYRKERYSYSVPFHVTLPYASYFRGGFALHEYPDVPAYAASHGCVRIGYPEAPEVYDFAAQGTPVTVY